MGAFGIPVQQPEASGLRNFLRGANARKIEPLPKRAEKEKYFVFNVSPLTWVRHVGVLGERRIRACKADQEHTDPIIVREYEYEHYEAGNQQINHRQWDGLDIARDLVGTMPPSHEDNDLTRYGVFISESNPPKAEELETARARMMTTFQELVYEGDGMWGADDAGRMFVRNSKLHKLAAKVIGHEAEWCTFPKAKVPCPACGEMVVKGAAIHASPTCGAILDEEKARKFMPHLFADAPVKKEKPAKVI